MPHHSTHIFVHLVFATKARQPFITEELRPQLEGYLAGIYARKRHKLLAQFAMPDHYHSLFRLHPAESLAEVVRRVKGGSSHWLNQNHFQGNFEWQTGYGAFGHLAGKLDGVIEYIRNQPTHHNRWSLQQETDLLNKKYGAVWSLD